MSVHMRNTPSLPLLHKLYLPAVFGLKQYMENREPFQLKGPLVCWNILLAVFSLYGAIVTLPPAWKKIQSVGTLTAICDSSCYYHPAAGMVLAQLKQNARVCGYDIFTIEEKPVIFYIGTITS